MLFRSSEKVNTLLYVTAAGKKQVLIGQGTTVENQGFKNNCLAIALGDAGDQQLDYQVLMTLSPDDFRREIINYLDTESEKEEDLVRLYALTLGSLPDIVDEFNVEDVIVFLKLFSKNFPPRENPCFCSRSIIIVVATSLNNLWKIVIDFS